MTGWRSAGVTRRTRRRAFGHALGVDVLWPLARVRVDAFTFALQYVRPLFGHTYRLRREDVLRCTTVWDPCSLSGTTLAFELRAGGFWHDALRTTRFPEVVRAAGWPVEGGSGLTLQRVLDRGLPPSDQP